MRQYNTFNVYTRQHFYRFFALTKDRHYAALHVYSMRLQITATDVAWSVCLCVSVVWATTVIPAKMAELIEMLSGCELVEPKEPCFRLGPASPTGGALLGGQAHLCDHGRYTQHYSQGTARSDAADRYR